MFLLAIDPLLWVVGLLWVWQLIRAFPTFTEDSPDGQRRRLWIGAGTTLLCCAVTAGIHHRPIYEAIAVLGLFGITMSLRKVIQG